MSLKIYLTYFLTIIIIILNQFIIKINGQCTWDYIKSNELNCNLRILDQGLNINHIPDIQQQLINKLNIKCYSDDNNNNDYNYKSYNNNNNNNNKFILNDKIFQQLKNLNYIKIDSCKLKKFNNNIFNNLLLLKYLIINTNINNNILINNDLYYNHNHHHQQQQQQLLLQNNNDNNNNNNNQLLDINKNLLNNLSELILLDLSYNNINKLPDGLWCSLNNLKILNLTMNNINNIKYLYFNNNQCLNNYEQLSELNELDISYNNIQELNNNWNTLRLRRLEQFKLQFNNITILSENCFNDLISLRILNLSNNYLEQLPINLFKNLKELREIHLQNNQLYDLPNNLLNHLEQLLILDLSSNQLTSHHIDNKTFSGLVRLIILNLSNNALTRIGLKTFHELYFLQILNLQNNSIGYIENDVFLPLYNLHTLNLAENRLHTLDNHIFNGLYVLSKLTLNNNLINIIELKTFRNCSSLKELDLSSNQLIKIPDAINDLQMLKTLDLGENQIKYIGNDTFKNLNQLTGLRLIDNQIGNITKFMFKNLPHLNVLNIAKNQIQSIEHGSFDYNIEIEAIRLDRNYIEDINGIFTTLKSLLWLNLSDNHLIWFDYAFIPKNLKWLDIHNNYIEKLGNYYKLQEEINIKTLDTSHNRINDIGPMSVPNSIELLFINNNLITTINTNTFVDKIHLARVDLYANLIKKLQLHSIRVAPVQNENLLPEFYLGGNPFECDCSMEWLQRINNLTTRQHPRIMDLINIECLMTHSRSEPIRSLITLNSKDFLCKYDRNCPALCHCCDFDACDCEMICPKNCSCYHDATWSTNIIDCGKQNNNLILPGKIPLDVTDLYLDGNNLPILKSQSFIGRRNLRALYLNSSNIITIENQTFIGLNMLQILHLENNILQTLEENEFSHLTLLKELYLHNNLLTTIGNMTFSPLVSLKILRIDNNRLITIPMQQLQLTNNLQFVSLGRNAWSCRCKFLQDLTQFISENNAIIQDSHEIYCVDGNIKRELDLQTSTTDCSEDNQNISGVSMSNQEVSGGYIPLLAAVLVLIFLIIILIIVFVFRESVRVWLFAHYGVRVCESRFEDAGKLYDGIILHSSKDYEFVCRNIAGELEHGRPPFRLCIQQRDLPPEASHLQIVEASRASRKVILVLTKNLLQTEWIRGEFRSAFHEALRGLTSKLVIIEETDVCTMAEDIVELSPYLKSIPSNRILTNDQYFWEKLRYAIPIELSPRSNNYTIDNNHHERFKQPVSPGVIFRQAPPPPAYYPEDMEANYSSATTATPSPRPTRHGRNDIIPMRPPSEHIYSSIESEYSAYDQHENLSMIPNGGCSSNSGSNNNGILLANLTPYQQQQFLIAQQQQQQQQPRVHAHQSPRSQQQQQQQTGHSSSWRAMNPTHAHLRTPSNLSIQPPSPNQQQSLANQNQPTTTATPTTQVQSSSSNISTGNASGNNNTNSGNVSNSNNNNNNNNNNNSSGGQAFLV